MGSEDALHFFFQMAYFLQYGSSETCLYHGQFEIKTFPIYAPPYYFYQVRIGMIGWLFKSCIVTVVTVLLLFIYVELTLIESFYRVHCNIIIH